MHCIQQDHIPSKKPKSGKIAVKVINNYRHEVLKVYVASMSYLKINSGIMPHSTKEKRPGPGISYKVAMLRIMKEMEPVSTNGASRAVRKAAIARF
jgi:hypothetical protein